MVWKGAMGGEFAVLVRTLQEDKNPVILVSSKHRVVLGMWFVLLTGVADRSESTSDHSLLLAAVFQLKV